MARMPSEPSSHAHLIEHWNKLWPVSLYSQIQKSWRTPKTKRFFPFGDIEEMSREEQCLTKRELFSVTIKALPWHFYGRTIFLEHGSLVKCNTTISIGVPKMQPATRRWPTFASRHLFSRSSPTKTEISSICSNIALGVCIASGPRDSKRPRNPRAIRIWIGLRTLVNRVPNLSL